MTWKKIDRGLYYLPGTRFAVQSDGYEKSGSISAHPGYEGFIGGEWATVRYREIDGVLGTGDDGDNLGWFDTMREAKARAEREATREAGDGWSRAPGT